MIIRMISREQAGQVSRRREVVLELDDTLPMDRVEAIVRLFAFEGFSPLEDLVVQQVT